MGLYKIPAWFLKIVAPFLAAPLSDMFNLSLASSVVSRQWAVASILPIPKSITPLQPADYRPIFITQVLSRILVCIVVRDFIYPSFLKGGLLGSAFMINLPSSPCTGSTVAAFIKLLHTITSLLDTHLFAIVYALFFSKTFDSVHQSSVLNTFSKMNLPNNIHNWIENFIRDDSHCTRFGDEVLQFRENFGEYHTRFRFGSSFVRCYSIRPACSYTW